MTTRRSIALILSPVGLLLISAGRLIIVANFNTTTAVTIASSGGFVNTLLGTVIPLVPVFMPYLALLLLLFRRFLLSIMTFIFAAFISPTSITPAEGFSLAKTDWNRINTVVLNNRPVAIVVVLAVLVALWVYNRSFIEGLSMVVVMVAALIVLIVIPNVHLVRPLRLASSNEHRIVVRASSGALGFSWREILLALLILAVVFIVFASPSTFSALLGRFSWLLTGVVAVVATIAFFPFVHFIYPVPQNHIYYAEVTHDMWLPAERIELNTHLAYYGYVLSSDSDWMTVLLANSRLIAYLSADEVVRRSVCQPKMPAQPKSTMSAQPTPNPPLIPWLYNRPSNLPPCGSQDEIPLITAFLSKGQSLIKISSITHTAPERIISLTNAHLHEKLSAALRTYECRHDWNAPTPEGQRFYYDPRLAPY
jgi:hypothetical protein